MKAFLEILNQGAVQAAPQMLGWIIEREFPEGKVQLKIVETEAYHQDDPASHSYRGLTKRNAPMFGPSGKLYVYFTYGMHYCLNIVAGPEGRAEGVLIRAAEPLVGWEIIRLHRLGVKDDRQLTNGPGKLAQALGVRDTGFSGLAFGPETLTLSPPNKKLNPSEVVVSPRIGIKQARNEPWRFYIKNNPYVSRTI